MGGSEAYKRTALHFGGGKDSLACLHLLRPRWHELTVVWLNSGTAFPETVKQMEAVAAMVPHFMEVRSDVMADISAHGWPVDVLPVQNSDIGRQVVGNTGAIKLRTWMECCATNYWAPMQKRMIEMGVTRIIRGQRITEKYKSHVRDGDCVDGVIYEMPLQDWTEEDVFRFLRKNNVQAPAYYAEVKSSLDCWNCTAYMDTKAPQIAYLEKHHPEKHVLVKTKLREIARAACDALTPTLEAAH